LGDGLEHRPFIDVSWDGMLDKDAVNGLIAGQFLDNGDRLQRCGRDPKSHMSGLNTGVTTAVLLHPNIGGRS